MHNSVLVCIIFISCAESIYTTARKFRLQSGIILYAGGFGKVESSGQLRAPLDDELCKCFSGKKYKECCKPYHDDVTLPRDPVSTVRSRFSAYASGLIYYIIKTTHPEHQEYVPEEKTSKRKAWERSLADFSGNYDFLSLSFDDEERDKSNSEDVATVKFTARLRRQSSPDAPVEELKELSKFLRVNNIWLYRDAFLDSNNKSKRKSKL